MAATHGGASTLNVLIKYYEEHVLKGKDPGSDEYLHMQELLVKAMQEVKDYASKPEVIEIFKQYGVIFDEDKDSLADLDDEPDPIFDDSEDDVLDGSENIIKTEEATHKDSVETAESIGEQIIYQQNTTLEMQNLQQMVLLLLPSLMRIM